MIRVPSVMIVMLLLLLTIAVLPLRAQIVVDDDFNDNSLNSALWGTASTTCCTVSETNQRLEILFNSSCSGPGFSGGIWSLYKFAGNFDVQVDYQLAYWPANTGIRVGLTCDNGTVERGNRWGSYTDYYSTNFCDGPIGGATSDISGKLRLVRNGSQISGYRWSGSSWTLIHTATCSPLNTFIRLTSWGHNYTPGATVAFDNFHLNSGTPNFAPSVANVLVTQRIEPSELTDIQYDINDLNDTQVTITLQASSNNGQSWVVPVSHAYGDVGANVVTGVGKHIIWNAGLDFPSQINSQMKIKVVADDGH